MHRTHQPAGCGEDGSCQLLSQQLDTRVDLPDRDTAGLTPADTAEGTFVQPGGDLGLSGTFDNVEDRTREPALRPFTSVADRADPGGPPDRTQASTSDSVRSSVRAAPPQ